MALRYNRRYVIKELPGGMCVMKRVCTQCGKKYSGERNICRECRNNKRRKDKTRPGKTRPNRPKDFFLKVRRKDAFERQRKRIAREMEEIEATGMSPEESSVYEILEAGVKLDETINYSAFERVAG